ncbi:unnamed protein product [Cuscuta campestris]|uniref:CCHC-type domain-containing protein n=1 Tax=Cuscuta campestris TaxID=132261 RepID=A0A484LZZ9_9ASTE|nr:unnamed protein product [Cuscuta campestris]
MGVTGCMKMEAKLLNGICDIGASKGQKDNSYTPSCVVEGIDEMNVFFIIWGPQLARCCVEVDISHLPPAKIHVQHGEEDMFLDFYYENVPSYCMDCGKIGHPKERCPLGKNRQDARPKDVKTDTAWQVVTRKKGKTKMAKKPEMVWKAKPYQTSMQLVQWFEGPGESSRVRENSVVADSHVQLLLPEGIFTISDPTLLTAFTMHKLFSPTPLEVKEDCMAIIPYEDCLEELLEDAEPDVGFYMDGGDIDSVCHYLEEFPSLDSPSPDLVVSSKLSKSSKPRERSHAMDDYLSLHTVIEESQILTCGFKHAASSPSIWISSVYGLHTRSDREDLWLSLRTLFPRSGPWIVGGDFNTVASLSEHKGVVCPDLGGIGDFAQVISECELVAPPFLESEFTWTVIEIRHLGQGLSDHRPLLFKSLSHHVVGPKPFRFLNVCCSHTSFKDLVASSWGQSFQGGGMRGLAFKLAALKRALLQWNKEVWDIIKVYVYKAVQEFFLGIPLPTVFGSTLITLIPKLEGAITLDQFRPISLSTFFNKILSRILNDRLKRVLPTLISPEQVAFQQGKSINEHVLMVKEMVHLLSANTRGGNCITKLDLSKAFDNISWSYLEQPKGFFPVQCGVKQGDPLSPLLFILAMEGFTSYFNHLANTGRISCFSSGKTVAPSHLLYADDIFIFTRADCRNLLRLKAALSSFGMAFGQAINFNKSQVIVHDKMRQEHRAKIKSILGIRCTPREFTYLGSTVVRGKLRKAHCQALIQKFERRIAAWYSRKLNQMGRLILIKHVLSSIPLHILAVQELPKSVIKCLHRMMTNFFWGAKDEGQKYHWRKWEKLCFPLHEGGLGVRDLGHCQRAAAMDLWWKVQAGLYGLMEHTLLAREISGLWKAYAAAAKAPFSAAPLSLQQMLLSWWFSSNKKSILGNVRFVLPGLLIWNIWKAYNSYILAQARFSKQNIMAATNQILQQWFWAKHLDTSLLYKSQLFSLGIFRFSRHA